MTERRCALAGWRWAPPDDAPEATLEFAWDDQAGMRVWRLAEGNARGFRLAHRDRIILDLFPAERRIVDRSDAGRATPEMIDHFIADQVAPRVAVHAGALVIHASAVRIGSGTALFVGASGLGKSTLAASFDQAGLLTIGDDAFIIELPGERWAARATHPSLRLRDDSCEAVLGQVPDKQQAPHYSAKHRLAIAAPPEVAPFPIAALFVLGSGDDQRVAMTSLSPREACMALVANLFALDPADASGARDRLEAVAQLVAAVPAFALDYPRDFSRLPAVRSAILARLQSLEA